MLAAALAARVCRDDRRLIEFGEPIGIDDKLELDLGVGRRRLVLLSDIRQRGPATRPSCRGYLVSKLLW
jgi:hypothetical protein